MLSSLSGNRPRFSFGGRWAIPELSLYGVWGRLTFSMDKGTVLRLNWSRRDSANPNLLKSSTSEELSIILGTKLDGTEVTLYRCHADIGEYFATGEYQALVYAKYLLIGTHFKTKEDIKFRSMRFRTLHLDEWLNRKGFTFDYSKKYDFIVKYKRPKETVVQIGPDLVLKIVFEAKYPDYDFVQKEAAIEQKAWLELVPSKPKTLEEILGLIWLVQGFLTLAMGTPANLLSVEGSGGKRKKVSLLDGEIRVLYGEIRATGIQSTLPFDMLFTYEDVSENFGLILGKWFDKAQILEPVYGLYLNTVYVPEMDVTTRFMSVIQALESYHRRTGENYEIKQDQHRRRIEEILEGVPENQRPWLKEKLRYSNEISLRKRLNILLTFCPEPLSSVLKDRRKFAHDVCVTRNYLTHYDLELEAEAIKGSALQEMTDKLTILLQCLFLEEIGVEDEPLNNICTSLVKRARLAL
jgi:hypothetical protein